MLYVTWDLNSEPWKIIGRPLQAQTLSHNILQHLSESEHGLALKTRATNRRHLPSRCPSRSIRSQRDLLYDSSFEYWAMRC